MQKYEILNKFFNYPDEPLYYFYALNFGPFVQLDNFMRLNYVTCLSGKNGSGKSSLMDAIKTAIIANRKYLTFNPKAGEDTTIDQYLNLFGIIEKIGPTLLIFAIEFPTERRGYTKAIFGVGWQNDPKGFYFYKENLSRKEVLPLIKNAVSVKSFIRSLEDLDLPGELHHWDRVVDYHRFLDEEEVFFFFPKDYDDIQSYHNYLSLLDTCTRILTSGKKIKIQDLKTHLFRPHKEKRTRK